MITTIILQLIGGAFKEVHKITYKNGSRVERIHTPGNPVPEDIHIMKPVSQPQLIMHPECAAYSHHYNVQL